MKLASFFVISLALHGAILTLPLSEFMVHGDRTIPVTLVLQKGERAAAKKVTPDAPQKVKPKPEKTVSPRRPENPQPVRRNQTDTAVNQPDPSESKEQPTRPTLTAPESVVTQTVSPPVFEKVVKESTAAHTMQEPADLDKKISTMEKPVQTAALKETQMDLSSAPPAFSGARYAYNPKPNYPDRAKREGWEGTVLLRVLVGSHGTPKTIEINRSSGFDLLDRAAHETVKGWRFHPAHRGDQRIESWVKIPIVFRLADAQK